MKIYCLLLITLLFTSVYTAAQKSNSPKIVINLSKINAFNETIGGFAAATTQRNERTYRFNKSGLAKFMVKRFTFEVSDASDYNQVVATNNSKNFVDVLIAKTYGDSTVFIVDKNRNLDFQDEETIITKLDTDYRFKSEDYAEFKPLLETTISYENGNGGNAERVTFPVMLFPFRYGFSYNDPLEDDLYFMMYSNEHSEGSFTANGKNYRVLVSKGEIGPFYLTGKSRFYFGENKRIDESEYKLKSIVTIGDANYSIDSLNRAGTALFLNLETGSKIIGNKVNQYLPDHYFTNELKDKDYLMVEFWGTWCVPCIDQMSVLKSFYDRTKTKKNELIGIDFESTVKERTRIVTAKGINWPLISNESADKDYVKFLNVTAFPTFFVINKDRKIVFKDTEIASLISFMKSSEVLNSK